MSTLATPMAPDASRSKVSLGLWIAVLWYALETTRGVSRWLTALGYEVAASTTADGTPIDRAVFTVLLILAVGVLFSRRMKWLSFFGNNRFICLLFAYMLISVVWSTYPDISFRRWTRSVVDLMMALIVMTDRDPFEAECALIRRVMFINIPLSIYLIKYVAAIGRSYFNDYGLEMWIGTTTHKNILGEVAMTAAIYFLFEFVRNLKNRKVLLYAVYLLMTGWILRGSPDSKSATSLVLVVVGAVILLGLIFLRTRMKHVAAYVFVGFLGVLLVVAALLVFSVATDQSPVEASIEGAGRDTTLTGRTDLWLDVWNIASENKLFGVGYGAFWVGNTHHLWDVHFWRPTQGHNGYLDVYVELGIVGVVLLVCTIIACFAGTMRLLTIRFEMGALHLVWLTVIVLHNITESSFLRGSMDLWFLFLMSSVAIPAGIAASSREPLSAPSPVLSQPTAGSRLRSYPTRIHVRPQ